MKYYAHFGHNDFILCLGYKGDVIKDYFLNYNEALSNDFVLADGGRARRAAAQRHRGLAHHVRRHRPPRNIGQRLRRCSHHLEGEESSSRTTATG